MKIEFLIILALFLHFCGDFVFQNDWMAQNKADNQGICALHSLIYGCFFIPFGIITALILAVFHFLVDNASATVCKELWKKEDRHHFFLMIGFDQFLHIALMLWLILKIWEL